MADRPLSAGRTAAAILVLALIVGLAGDACHVAAGTTRYEWDGVPALWRSAIWFPVALSGAVLAAAWLSERAGTPAVRVRTRADAVAGAAVVLALYAVTALLNDAPTTVSVVLVGADRRGGVGLVGPVAGRAGGGRAPPRCWARWPRSRWWPPAPPATARAWTAWPAWRPWLPCLYFAAGAVAARLWAATRGPGWR